MAVLPPPADSLEENRSTLIRIANAAVLIVIIASGCSKKTLPVPVNVPVSAKAQAKTITMEAASVPGNVFQDDIVPVKVTFRATGYEAGHVVQLRLTNAATHLPLTGPDGKPAEKSIAVPDANPLTVELPFKAVMIGPLQVAVEAVRQPGESEEHDNALAAGATLVDRRITVLYVEGYPRWEYRHLKNDMMRENAVLISCILTSTAPTFVQPHSDLAARGLQDRFKHFPFKEFPGTMEQLMECDVVLLGDVDSRQFTTSQLQLIADFVNKKGGGFGMIAGPQWSPGDYRNTPVEALLPVTVVNANAGWPKDAIEEGFRPVLTEDGLASPIFRFLADPLANQAYFKEQLQPLYWYRSGIVAKPGSKVLAEHPTQRDPDGHRVPLLVTGRSGAGNTLFSAYDDSWRWRLYTGRPIFDTYWLQQFRYLALGRKMRDKAQ